MHDINKALNFKQFKNLHNRDVVHCFLFFLGVCVFFIGVLNLSYTLHMGIPGQIWSCCLESNTKYSNIPDSRRYSSNWIDLTCSAI